MVRGKFEGHDYCVQSTLASIKAEETEERANPDGQQRALSSATAGLLEQLFLALHYLYTDNMKYAEDYRCCADGGLIVVLLYTSPSLAVSCA